MNTTTNIVVIVILVLLVGFGVWYFTVGNKPQESPGPSLQIDLKSGGEGQNTGGTPGGY